MAVAAPETLVIGCPDEVSFVIGGRAPDTTSPTAVADAAIHLALATQAIAVVRGVATAVADPDTRLVRVLDDPCPGLGVAGSGDVLAGTLAGHCTRTSDLAAGAEWTVLVHHEAGRLLEQRVGPLGFLAREIGDVLPDAMRNLAPVTAPGV